MAFNATLINKNYQTITGSVGSRVYNGGNFGFDPRSIQNTILYLDALYPSNVITDSATNVTQWNDLSVKSLQTLPQYSVTGILNSNPTYSSGGVNFSGTSYLTGSVSAVGDLGTTDFAIFVVVKVPTTTASQYILSKYSTANLHWELYFTADNKVVFNYTYTSISSKTVTSVGVTADDTIVIAVIAPRKMPFGMNIYINGVGAAPVSGVSTTISSASNLYIGSDSTQANCLQSSINEILIYQSGITSTTTSSVMSRNQQQQIEGYLAWKWNLQSNLPLGTSIDISGFTLTSNTFRLSATMSMADNAGVIFRDLPTGVAATLYYVLNPTTSSKDFQLTVTKSGTIALSPTFSIAQSDCRAWYGATYIKTTGYSTGTGKLTFAQPGLFFTTGQTFVLSNSVAGLTAGIIYYAGYQNSSQKDELYVANSNGNFIALHGPSTFTAYLIKEPNGISVNSWTGANSKNAFFSTTDLIQGQSIVFPNSYAGLTANYPYYVYENSNTDKTFHVYDDVYYTQSALSGNTSSITALINSSMYNTSKSSAKLYSTKPFLKPFLPPDIVGCVLWLDGADPSSISSTAGFTWNDKSGSGNDATLLSGCDASRITYTNGVKFAQGFDSNSIPTVGNSAMLDVNNLLATSGNDYATYKSIFVVCKPTAFTERDVDSLSNVSNVIGSSFLSMQYIQLTRFPASSSPTSLTNINVAQSNSTLSVSQNTYVNNQYLISTHVDNIASRTLAVRCNGVVLGSVACSTDTTAAYTRLAGGRNDGNSDNYYNRYDGYINEVIIYQSTDVGLTNSQIQQIEGYLAWKWGLPNPNTANPAINSQPVQPLLPTTHPFTNFPSATVVPY